MFVLTTLLTASACGSDDAGAGEDTQTPADTGNESEGESETGEPAAAPGDSCEDSLLVHTPTTVRASLRHATPSSFPPSCGATGPLVFLRVKLEDRVDVTLRARGRAYTPKLAVQLPGCVSAQDDPARLLGCVDALPQTFMDIGPDAELLVTVGIDEDDPALGLPAPDADELEALDPLDFELDIDLRAVLSEGQACGSGQGRCEGGTVCQAADEDGFELERCHRPPADSCVAPGQLAVPEPGVAIEFEIPPDEVHSDAHEHACTGWRRPERVERLELPASLPSDAALVVRADDPRVGLALRGSSCLPESALACAPALPSMPSMPSMLTMLTMLTWGGDGELSALAEAGDTALLFIELPNSDNEPEPVTTITVSVEIAVN